MSDLALLLIGAGIALVSGLIGAWVNHALSLRADRIKWERDKRDREARELSEVIWSDGDREHPVTRQMAAHRITQVEQALRDMAIQMAQRFLPVVATSIEWRMVQRFLKWLRARLS
jgi:hypothetical protein